MKNLEIVDVNKFVNNDIDYILLSPELKDFEYISCFNEGSGSEYDIQVKNDMGEVETKLTKQNCIDIYSLVKVYQETSGEMK